MKLDLQKHRSLFCGISWMEQTPEGVLPCRFSPENVWAKNADFMNHCSAGVRLRFQTNSSSIRMSVVLGESIFPFEHGFFSIIVNRKEAVTLEPQPPYSDHQHFQWSLDLPPGNKNIEIFLPSYRKVAIRCLELSDGAVFAPLPQRPRTLFLGDSITQGYAAYPAYSYVSRLSRKRNRDFLNFAVGGAQMPGALPEKILEEDFDETFIAFGTNDANRCRPPLDFSAAADQTLSFFRRKAGNRLFVVSPIPVPKFADTEKTIFLLQYAEILREAAKKHNAHFINGNKLVPHDPALFYDGCHPTNDGMCHYADNLYQELKTYP